MLTVKRPPATVNTEEYLYTNYVASPLSPFKVTHKRRDDAGGDNYLYTWTFSDGLGRVVQTQAEAADGSQSSILVNREYDGLGHLKRESLPYYGAAGGTYRSPDWGQSKRQSSVST